MKHPIESPPQPFEAEPHASGAPLVITLLVLLVLTLTSWAISHVALGWASTAIALAIAVVKAGFVAHAFMELPLASTPARITILVTVSFIAILCMGTVADIGLR
jgi:caa(3)-type oxidase subunit IV